MRYASGVYVNGDLYEIRGRRVRGWLVLSNGKKVHEGDITKVQLGKDLVRYETERWF